MKCISVLLLVTIFGGTWRLGRPTCVLESDFGIILNCAFKKSGLFRVRNLGGVKAHIGLGFTVGDELGFKESLSNTEVNRRRSAQVSNLQAQLIQAQQNSKKASNSITVRSPSPSSKSIDTPFQVVTPLATGAVQNEMKRSSSPEVPPFKPIPPADERPTITLTSSHSRPSVMGSLPISPSGAKVMAVVAVPKKQLQAQDKISSTNFAVRTLPAPDGDLPAPIPQHSSNSIQALLAANNVTEEALELALIPTATNYI
ncbi:hypothetical protein JTB14_022790 [Gonioctena quinquepunctata]|nr:hypothetical protein JTB14_022790 [Gonioctena quinquepunctata]